MRAVKNESPNSEIAEHARKCNNCLPDLGSTVVLSNEKDCAKEVLNVATRITNLRNCMSQPSMTLGEATRKCSLL